MTQSCDFAVRDTRQPGHFWADNEVLDVYAPRLGCYVFAVYLVLARYAQNGTGEVRISLRKISACLRINHSTVLTALEVLVENKLVLKLAEGDRITPTTYALADVKVLVDPEDTQLRLTGPPRVVTTQPQVVTTQPQVVGYEHRVVTTQPRNKERKTFTRLNTKPKPSPTPPASQEGLPRITTRDRRKLHELVTKYQRAHLDEFGHPRWEGGAEVQPIMLQEAIRVAACFLLLPIGAAFAVYEAAGALKREEPQHATA